MIRNACWMIGVLAIVVAGCAAPTDPGGGPRRSPTPAAHPTTAPATGSADAVAAFDRCEDVQRPQQGMPAPADGDNPPSPFPTPDVQVRHEEVQDLDAWAAQALGEDYGGLFLDFDTIVVLTAGDPAAIESDLAARTDLPFRVEQVANSAAELEDARRALQSLASGGAQGTEGGSVTAIGTMVLANRVFVSILGDPTPIAEEVAALVDPHLVCLELEDLPDADDAQPAQWQVDPSWQSDPAATEVPILLSEVGCHGYASPEGRIVVRDITYEEDRVVADLGVIPLGGPQTCPGTPPFPTSLQLDEPLGDRDLAPAPGQDLDEPFSPAPAEPQPPSPTPIPAPTPTPTATPIPLPSPASSPS